MYRLKIETPQKRLKSNRISKKDEIDRSANLRH